MAILTTQRSNANQNKSEIKEEKLNYKMVVKVDFCPSYLKLFPLGLNFGYVCFIEG